MASEPSQAGNGTSGTTMAQALSRTVAELRRQLRLLKSVNAELSESRNFALHSWQMAVKRAARLADENYKLRVELAKTRVYPATKNEKAPGGKPEA